jgi:hypothetical protein
MEASDAADLETLGRLSEDVVSDARRSLALLRDIETTIQALCYERTRFEGPAKFAHLAAEGIRGAKRVRQLDPEGEAEAKLLKAQNIMRDLYNKLVEKREYARHDDRLTEEDGVVDEFTRTISVVADLHNGLNELRWAVGEFDADLAKGSGPIHESAGELEGFLKTL